MKATITGFINFRKESWDATNFHGMYFHGQEMTDCGYVTVMPYSVEVDVPDDFNPIYGQVQALEKAKREIKAKFAMDLMRIEDSISKLTCISMDEPA